MLDSAQVVTITVDGAALQVPRGANLAAALAATPRGVTRDSVGGEPRGPLCGMGVCFECRVTVDGAPHVRACMTTCRAGLVVETRCAESSERRASSAEGGRP